MARARQKLDRAEWAKLPQDVQALYAEHNGQYVLDSEDAEELRTAFERTKEELAAAKRRMEAAKDIDPEEYQRLKAAAEKASRDNDLAKGNFEKVLAEETKTHAAEMKKRDEHIAALKGQLQESLVDGELTRAIASYPGARTKLLLPVAKQSVALREIDGRLRSVVLDAKGEPRIKPGSKDPNEYMEPADLIAEMRNDKEYAGAFPAQGGSVRAQQERSIIQPPGDQRSQDKRATLESITQQVRDGAVKLQ